jgi:hypothetical protein
MRDINKIVYHNVKVEETRMCNESSWKMGMWEVKG